VIASLEIEYQQNIGHQDDINVARAPRSRRAGARVDTKDEHGARTILRTTLNLEADIV